MITMTQNEWNMRIKKPMSMRPATINVYFLEDRSLLHGKLSCLNDAMCSCLQIFVICNILALQDLYSIIYMLKCAVHEK